MRNAPITTLRFLRLRPSRAHSAQSVALQSPAPRTYLTLRTIATPSTLPNRMNYWGVLPYCSALRSPRALLQS